MKALKALAWAAGTVVLILVIMFVSGGLKWVTAEFRGSVAQREATVANAPYRIAAYDSFFDSCEAIAAKERIIAGYEEDLAEPDLGRGDKALLTAALRAEKNVRQELIGAYNADASKAGTRAQFLASELPYRIDPQGVTTCSV